MFCVFRLKSEFLANFHRVSVLRRAQKMQLNSKILFGFENFTYFCTRKYNDVNANQ
jgi:hypothetical protein